MRQLLQRFISILIAVVIVFSMLPFTAKNVQADADYSGILQNGGIITVVRTGVSHIDETFIFRNDSGNLTCTRKDTGFKYPGAGAWFYGDDMLHIRGVTNTATAGYGTFDLEIDCKNGTYTYDGGKYGGSIKSITVTPPPHNHSFSYTASDNTITADCVQTIGICSLESDPELTISAPSDLVYDGNAKSVSFNDGYNTEAFPDISDHLTYTKGGQAVAAEDVKDVGDYTASVSYDSAEISVSFSITKADNPATISIEDWTYGEEAKSPIIEDNLGNGAVSYFYSGTACDGTSYSSSDAPALAGTYEVTATIEETDNYNGAETSVSFNILQKEVSVSGITAQDKPYDDTTIATLDTSEAVVTGTLNGDELTVSASADAAVFDDSNAGEDITVVVDYSKLTLSGTNVSNYTLPSGTFNLTADISKLDQPAPAAPTVQSSSEDSITLTPVDNCEYKCDDGDWQDSNTFPGLEVGTEYTFYQRLKEDANHNASPQSPALVITIKDNGNTEETIVDEDKTTIIEKDPDGDVVKTTEIDDNDDGTKTVTETEGNKTTVTEINDQDDVIKKTETVTNDDGTKTVTETEGNKTTVTEIDDQDEVTKTTETVTNDDGTTTETVTEGDTTTITEKDKDGDVTKTTEIKENDDGTTTVTEEEDGNVKVTEYDEDGETVSVTLNGEPVIGTLETEVVIASGAPAVSVSNLDAAAQAEQTSADNFAKVKFWLVSSDVDASVLTTDEKTSLQGLLDSLGATAGTYMDLSLYKQVDNGAVIQITETATKLQISVTIPSELKADGRTFYLIRVHDGKAEVIATTKDGVLTGESDLFSTYVIAYKDDPTSDSEKATPVPTPAAGPDKASGSAASASGTTAAMPSTGENASATMWIGSLLAVISGVVLVYVLVRRRKANQ